MASTSIAGAVSHRRLQRATSRQNARGQIIPTFLLTKLTQLDDRLATVLGSGVIRIVRIAWLQAQPLDYRMQRCQDLEELERSGVSPSPLLTPQEAVDLLRKGGRLIGTLSYGWLTPGQPDPEGARIEVLRTALEQHPHIEGLFWEYAPRHHIGSPQHNLNEAEQERFKAAINVMGDLYASAIGTTVLQLKAIPPRPFAFDGALCLFDVRAGVDEDAICSAFAAFGQVECSLASGNTVVSFATRLSALEAKGHGAPTAVCAAIEFQYNERKYDERGWCVFEEAVSDELIVRLNPRLRTALEALPPKKVVLGDVIAPRDEPMQADTRVETVVERIVAATFTGAGDKSTVISLYKEYAERISSAVLAVMGMAPQAGAGGVITAGPHAQLPSVSLEPPEPLRLTSGQLVLLRHGEGGGTQFGAVDSSGREVTRLLSAVGSAELWHDGCVQDVLPWKTTLEDGWAEALRHDVEALGQLGERVRMLAEAARRPPTEAGLKLLSDETRAVVEVASKVPSVAKLRLETNAAVRTPLEAASRLLQEAAIRPGSDQADATQRGLDDQMGRVRSAIAQLEPEALAAAALRATGGIGLRRYAVGQQLVVRMDGGVWHEAEVVVVGELGEHGEHGARHQLRLGDAGTEGTTAVALHPWNHAPRELPQSTFAELSAWHASSMREQHSHIADALSGQQLQTLQQCVAIDVVGGSSDASVVVKDAHGLAAWLRSLHEERSAGSACSRPPAALLTAGPAAGKTTLLSQVMALSLDGELVPILVNVQRLQRRLLDAPGAFASAWNWVDAFLELELGEAPAHYRFLRQAMMARRALLLLDGLDEGGQKRGEIEAHVANVLAPQGHVLLCTSRPAGVSAVLFTDFARLELSPLTEAQQEQALRQRLGRERAGKLMPYVRGTVPCDAETGARVTSNPLMLSMVASVFELRGDLQMPSTVAELYEVAADAMLGRGGATSDALRRLLQRIFFEAHVAQRRIIEDRQLDEAALGLERPEALAAIRERAAQAPFPPFKGRAEIGHYVEVVEEGEHAGKRGLITADDKSSQPYKVTFADGQASGWLYPNQLKSSGLNETALLGQAMSENLGQVHAACSQLPEATRKALAEVRRRIAQDTLPLLSLLQVEPLQLQSSHLSFQEYFAARAICEEGTVLSGSPPWQWPAWWANALAIGEEMGEPFAKGLVRAAGINTGDTLNLSKKKLAGDRPTVLRVVKVLMSQLTSLDLSENGLDAEAVKVLAEVVAVSASVTSLSLAQNDLGDDGAEALSIGLKENKSIKTLDLSGKGYGDGLIGPRGATALASAIAVIPSVTDVNLSDNNLTGGKYVKQNELSGSTFKAGDKVMHEGQELTILKEKDSDGDVLLGSLDGVIALAEALKVTTSVTSVNVLSNQLDVDSADLLLKVKAEKPNLRTLCGLTHEETELDLGRKSLGPGDAKLLAPEISVIPSVTKILVGGNKLCDEGTIILCDALRVSTVSKVQELGLSTNGIGPDGAKAVAALCAAIASVTECNLRENDLGVEGWTIIFNALRDSPMSKIITWDLSGEMLGPGIAKTLADYISVTPSVTKILVSGNRLGDAGTTILCDALRESTVTKVQELGLSNNIIGPEGAKAVAAMAAVVASITSLSLGDNKLGEEGKALVRKAVEGRSGFELKL